MFHPSTIEVQNSKGEDYRSDLNKKQIHFDENSFIADIVNRSSTLDFADTGDAAAAET